MCDEEHVEDILLYSNHDEKQQLQSTEVCLVWCEDAGRLRLGRGKYSCSGTIGAGIRQSTKMVQYLPWAASSFSVVHCQESISLVKIKLYAKFQPFSLLRRVLSPPWTFLTPWKRTDFFYMSSGIDILHRLINLHTLSPPRKLKEEHLMFSLVRNQFVWFK